MAFNLQEFTVSQADKVGWTPVTNMQVAVTPSKQVALPGDIIRKPRFLDSLETFLERELQSLGVETVQPNETRLQVCVLSIVIKDSGKTNLGA